MAAQSFSLTIRGELTDPRLDALFEAGCDDATFSSRGDLTYAAFDRDADSLLDAVGSAIEAVESVTGMEVVHVDPDDMVWASEIAERIGRSRQSVDQLIKGQRGPGHFPAPASHATRNPLWRWADVEAWFAAYQGTIPDSERSATIGAINGALQARRSLRDASGSTRLREVVSHLVAS